MTRYTASADTSAVGNVIQGGVTSIVIVYATETIQYMLPFVILSMILIVVDLVFGIEAAKIRYTKTLNDSDRVKPSRAIRKTVNKLFEYICWVILSASLAVSFRAYLINVGVMGFIVANELISIIDNYMYVHGKKIYGLQEFIKKLIGAKINADTSDIRVEDMDDGRS